jgi:hypothetical protein
MASRGKRLNGSRYCKGAASAGLRDSSRAGWIPAVEERTLDLYFSDSTFRTLSRLTGW